MQYFKKILHFAYPYSKYAYLNIFFNLIYAVFSALSFLALIPMLDVLFNTTEYVDTPPKYVGISDAKNFIKNYVNYQVSQVVLENPINSAIWIVNKLALMGEPMLKGQYISTGTCTPAIPISKDNFIKADFGKLGLIEINYI